MAQSESKVDLIIDGKRVDGRGPEDIRDMRIVAGVTKEAAGSAFVEWGKNKVICGVYGPRECIPKHGANPYRAIVKCRYTMSPFASIDGHGRSGPNRRSIEISKVISEVFDNLILTERYPNTQIDVYIDVLQADGGTRIASVVAASVALAAAGIPMKDMASGVAIGKADGVMLLDLGKEEDNFGQSDMPIVISNREKDILLLQMDGMLTKAEIAKALDMTEKGCAKVYAKQVEALRRLYEGESGEFKL
ncbi:MAG: exosome complex exonuclease Rrp41 [Candidatus Bilamarchaeaceae archaeon]